MLEGLSGETRLYPIIGDPIIYVKSPERLTRGFAARGHNGICVPVQVPEGDLESVMGGLMLIPNIGGLLITMPHKFTVYTHCATRSERSKRLEVGERDAPQRRRLLARRHARRARLCEGAKRSRCPAGGCARAASRGGRAVPSPPRCSSRASAN